MPNGAAPFPTVETAVLVLVRDGQLLAVYNEPWGAFTLPMTKRRQEPGPTPDAEPQLEAADSTAVRVVAETLGRPLGENERPERVKLDLQPYRQSDRDGQWKRYTHSVFVLRTQEEPRPVDGAAWIWLDPKDAPKLSPVSPTLQDIVSHLQGSGFSW